MISKQAFFLILGLVVIGLGYNLFHHIGHDADVSKVVSDLVDKTESESDLTEPKDMHTHQYYWSGEKGNPNELVRSHNDSYGIPNDVKPHRHTGADYWQHGDVTWKHVNDQHQKLPGQ